MAPTNITAEMVEMNDTPRNRATIERYKTLVTTHYKEPGQDDQFDEPVQRMYWRNCAKMITQMSKKNLRRILTLITSKVDR